eukprot:6180471-Pleurochrysis_carterae.AAC.1
MPRNTLAIGPVGKRSWCRFRGRHRCACAAARELNFASAVKTSADESEGRLQAAARFDINGAVAKEELLPWDHSYNPPLVFGYFYEYSIWIC